MKRLYLIAALSLLLGGIAMAQGVAQSPTQTVTQQRQSGSLVNGGTTAPLSTNPTSTGTSTYGSPFSSPFGSAAPQKKGGYKSPY
jgi:hypothetical protein